MYLIICGGGEERREKEGQDALTALLIPVPSPTPVNAVGWQLKQGTGTQVSHVSGKNTITRAINTASPGLHQQEAGAMNRHFDLGHGHLNHQAKCPCLGI